MLFPLIGGWRHASGCNSFALAFACTRPSSSACERNRTMVDVTRFALGFAALAAAGAWMAAPALADTGQGFLETIHHHRTVASTVPDNGDLNPYAIVVAPVSAGIIRQHDLLIGNFNNQSNLQGTGTTIVDYNPETKKTTIFAKLPQNLATCPGGVGLSTALTMLKTGWV